MGYIQRVRAAHRAVGDALTDLEENDDLEQAAGITVETDEYHRLNAAANDAIEALRAAILGRSK